jgi:hypothetical protein
MRDISVDDVQDRLNLRSSQAQGNIGDRHAPKPR